VKSDEEPGPDEPPKKDQRPGEEQVLIERKARNPGARVAGDVPADLKGKKQDDSDEAQETAEAERITRPAPKPHSVLERAGWLEPNLQLVEADVDCRAPVRRLDLDDSGSGFDDPIVGPRMGLPREEAGGNALAQRLQEPAGRRLNRKAAFDLVRKRIGSWWRHGRRLPPNCRSVASG
jgi:hypothetical protein